MLSTISGILGFRGWDPIDEGTVVVGREDLTCPHLKARLGGRSCLAGGLAGLAWYLLLGQGLPPPLWCWRAFLTGCWSLRVRVLL